MAARTAAAMRRRANQPVRYGPVQFSEYIQQCPDNGQGFVWTAPGSCFATDSGPVHPAIAGSVGSVRLLAKAAVNSAAARPLRGGV